MKRNVLTTIVIALFAIGFTASKGKSGNSESDEVKYSHGERYRKVYGNCAKCGESLWWWQSEEHEGSTIGAPHTFHGERYCSTCYSYYKDMEQVTKKIIGY